MKRVKLKLANPFFYPLPMLVGSVALVVGVRFAKLPSAVMLPVAGAIATLGAAIRKAQEPETFNLQNLALENDLHTLQQQAKILAAKAEDLRIEAARLLTASAQVDLLAAIQFACDRAGELPAKITQLAKRMQGSDSLLSSSDLEKQLTGVEAKLRGSSGIMRQQLTKLADSLNHNIQLAQEGQDARQIQLASLSTLILDTAGVLQKLQNKIRSSDLSDTQQTLELELLSDQLHLFQENVDLMVEQ
jgi:hypothetical protein